MAFLQDDFPPSTAPVRPQSVIGRPRRPMPFAKAAPRRYFTRARLVGGGLLAATAAAAGSAAFAATESVALAILAGDFAFLIAVAAWSTVSAR